MLERDEREQRYTERLESGERIVRLARLVHQRRGDAVGDGKRGGDRE